MDEHELAWAAGFFDGDGWAAAVLQKGRRTSQPYAQINQGSLAGVPEVLMRFHDVVGVGRVAGPKIEEGRQPLYWWVASSRRDVERTGSLIGPWLSHEKRDKMVEPWLKKLPEYTQSDIMNLFTFAPSDLQQTPKTLREFLLNTEFEDPSPSML